MIPTIHVECMTSDDDELPVLLLGPSLGTTAATLWSTCVTAIEGRFRVLAWDLPGHGRSATAPEDFSMSELAQGVLRGVDDVLGDAGATPAAYAGDSVGGAVGLQILLGAPQRLSAAVLLCTGARIGTAETWTARVDQVRSEGTSSLVPASTERWFGPGFTESHPDVSGALLDALAATTDEGYAQVCRALADFDVRDRLAEIDVPVLCVAGADDAVTPPASLAEIAVGVRHGRTVELPGVAHLAPAEAPTEVAALIVGHPV